MSRGALAIGIAVALGACGGQSSDITIAYRGDVAAVRQLVRVTLDTGARARTVTPAFPSAAHPEPIATRGALPIRVVLLSGIDTIARYSAPPLSLEPNTSYVVSVIVSLRRPVETPCTGRWSATPIVPKGAPSRDPTTGSLYVSIAQHARGEQPDCEE